MILVEATRDSPVPIDPNQFRETHTPPESDALLMRRIGDIPLNVGGTRLEGLAHRLYEEMANAGLSFRPPVYLSDEWGCPDRVPIIGLPFYLADEGLTRLHDEMTDGVEAETDDEIMRYLRHEAGHAFNYAYKLYETVQWTDVFGPFARPYPDEYTPHPFSRDYVRHLPGWYAQKHPDEDFAETFAVWLNPESGWREAYAGWGCLRKLEYLDTMARTIGANPPTVTAEAYDTREEFLAQTVGDFYRGAGSASIGTLPGLDASLRDIFVPPGASEGKSGERASTFLRMHRRSIVRATHYWTGLSHDMVRALLDRIEERAEALDLRVGADAAGRLIEATVFVTALCMNRLRTGDFVAK